MEANLNSEITAIIAINKEEIIYQFNAGAEALLGYSASEMIGKKKTNFFLVEEEYKSFEKDIASRYKVADSNFHPYQLLAQNNDYDSREWTVRRKDGTTFIANSTLIPLKNDSGESVGFMRILKNVTDQKRIENDLLRKNQVLNASEKITMTGNWQLDTVINKVQWSSNLFNIFEVDPSEDLNFETYFNLVHPEDKEIVSSSFEKSISNKKFYDLLHRIQLTSGKTKTIQLLGEVITDNEDNVIEIIGTCQDVTEQRMAEIKFKGLLESAPDAMVIVNDHGKIQLINRQAEKMFGYPSEELLNKSVELLIPIRYKHKHTSHRDGFFKLPKTRKMGQGRELYALTKNGREIPIQISLSPL
ncbi:MAG: PAS domain S-box protein, partial [Oceanihabitans sp.]|nr:PAS domain S-box protein [Oceanihabitans sp.]